MSRTATRKRRNLDQNKPPFKPLEPEAAKRIAKEGGLACGDDPEFYDALEGVRDVYGAHYMWREHVAIGNRDFRAKIQGALGHISGLKEFFSDVTISAASFGLFYCCDQEQSGATPDPDNPGRVIALARQREALCYLEDWISLLLERFEHATMNDPNWLAPKSAADPPQIRLALNLAGVWRSQVRKAELPVGRKSRWIRFLCQAH